jgi:hypothetical protein
MPFTIQSDDVAAVPARQSVWYDVDIAILVAGIAGTGVLTGCEVTAQGTPDMTVAVASGSIQPAAGETAVSVTGDDVDVDAADSDPRIDLITASAAGVLTYTAGTAATDPKPPALPSGHIALAMIDVPGSATEIDTAQITDKRVNVFAASGGGGGGASFPGIVQIHEGQTGNSLSGSIMLDQAPAEGHSLILAVSDSSGSGPSSVSSDNTTWTKLDGPAWGLSVWVGVCGASAGTVLTVDGLGSYSYATIIEINQALTPTLAHGGVGTHDTTTDYVRLADVTAGHLIVAAVTTNGTTGTSTALSGINPPTVGATNRRASLIVGYATGPETIVEFVSTEWCAVFLGEIT